MAPLIITVILVCGFWYTENHYQSRIHHARTNGWSSYFYVAMHGCRFVAQGFLLVLAVYMVAWLLGIIPFVINLFRDKPLEWHFLEWLVDAKVMGLPLFAVTSMLFACLIAYSEGKDARKVMENEDARQKAYREMASKDSLESLLVQAIDTEMLIFVTLKSRKVYIGYVAAPRVEFHSSAHLEIIPFISGYRDKDSLRYREQHRYYDLYLAKGITFDSTPLNLQHFRHVIPIDQIEAVSLFDEDTYGDFEQFSEPLPDVKESPVPQPTA
ncbi:hypothetical protein N0P75_08645 [Citrobacter youngae]|uniref:hypothetical protein n=1 Tax=Citrobacter TaxID=544 RepID=UPI001797DAB5|nr:MULTISPECIES: hypothetical protein [Citrobacter]MBA7968564.1 hypothetical protein [Citrobacter sp. RHBSTW-00671]MBJ9109984.1 hypothetical protein [Citrobacter sp. FDAARGOS_156]MBJ9156759.1 hypothetical protein [Citrobacter sp. FDAARGOS_156]MBJ9202176.1 hypothetical protein [Citrobacter sp. FDAARGOS_156]MBK6259084.1 hypothetical protein [Citrobacter youngae]